MIKLKLNHTIYRGLLTILLFLLVACQESNPLDSTEYGSPANNSPAVVSVTLPDVLKTDSTYTISVSVTDEDRLKSVSLEEEFNGQTPVSTSHSVSTTSWDTTFTREFEQPGTYRISVYSLDNSPEPEQITEEVIAEVASTFEERSITQTADRINGKQGTTTDFNLADYFETSSSYTSVQVNTDSPVTTQDLGNNSYRLSQPDDITGTHMIEILLANEDGATLETELEYYIAPVSGDDELVIMPLGDSITNDSRSRVQLWNLLVDDGYSVDYVGNQYQESSIPDPNHEGVGGIKIGGIVDKAASLMQNHQPKYVNLMVGTNDIAWYFDETGQEIADRWNALVQIILDNSPPGTYVIAATIPPMSSKMVGQSGMPVRDRANLTEDYNAALREHVNERQDAGDLIVLADMEAAMNVGQHVSGDGVHLNSAGYELMGTVYYEAIKSVLANNP